MTVYSTEAKKIIRAIADDMTAGIVSADVTSFSELHDYVDANVYLIDHIGERVIARPCDRHSGEDFASEHADRCAECMASETAATDLGNSR